MQTTFSANLLELTDRGALVWIAKLGRGPGMLSQGSASGTAGAFESHPRASVYGRRRQPLYLQHSKSKWDKRPISNSRIVSVLRTSDAVSPIPAVFT